MKNSTKVGFVHIPKTGGTYVAQKEGGISDSVSNSVISPIIYYNHVIFSATPDIPNPKLEWGNLVPKKDISELYMCSIVRNPYSWLVSGAIHWGAVPRPDGGIPSLSDREQFSLFIKTLCNKRCTSWPSCGLIFRQLWSDDGDLIFDWISRTETLDRDLETLAKMKGLKYVRAPKMRVQGVSDYRIYYTDALVEIVANTWKRDFMLFGYGFDKMEADMPKALIKNEVTSENRSLRYDFYSDTLHGLDV